MTVSLVKFDGSLDSLRRAIELCDGFERLSRNEKTLGSNRKMRLAMRRHRKTRPLLLLNPH
jgi:hypothetical protein